MLNLWFPDVTTTASFLAPDKKYFKRGDLAARDTEEYRRRSGLIDDGTPSQSAIDSLPRAAEDHSGTTQLSRAEVSP